MSYLFIFIYFLLNKKLKLIFNILLNYMVNSKINRAVNYSEIKELDYLDAGNISDIWVTEIKNNKVLISLGKLNYSNMKQNVFFINIYLIRDDKVISKIGVYEFDNSNLSKIEEKIQNDTLDIDIIGEPLLFSFVTNNFLDNYEYVEEESEGESEGEIDTEKNEPIDKQHDEVLIKHYGEDVDREKKVIEEEEEEEEEEYLKKNKDFEFDKEQEELTFSEDEFVYTEHEEGKNNWVNHFMKSEKYNIIDNEGGGECLFAVIRDAYNKREHKLSISKMRELLSTHVTKEIFDNYYTLYTNFVRSYQNTNEELKQLQEQNKQLQDVIQSEKDGQTQRVMLEQLENLEKEIELKISEKNTISGMLSEYRFMKNINTIDELREKIKTCEFWADTWAITTLEKILKIKLVLFSSENYIDDDKDNVLLCGQVNDEEQQSFEPSVYILTDYNGAHYQLITYNNKRLFTFEELPMKVKKLIINKCLEKQSGIYSFIPSFTKLKFELQEKQMENMSEKEKIEKLKVENEKQKMLEMESQEQMVDPLYNEKEGGVFQFYSRSRDADPGKGSGEKIKVENINKYSKLNKINNWRKKLSNFDKEEFTLDGHKWQSVEHFYHGSKFKRNNPKFYYLFSLDSGSEISKDPLLAKGAGSKTGKFKGKLIRDKSIVINENFYSSGRNDSEMERAMMAKFSQNPESKEILLETKDAKLIHFVKGKPAIVFNNLMRVRKNLKELEGM